MVAAYEAYAQRIRAEYAHVPEDEYRARRATVLQQLVAPRALFHTPEFAAREDRARSNVAREVRMLRERQAQQ